MNKNIKWVLGLIVVFNTWSCSKELKTEYPNFKVSVADTIVKAGEPVVFNFEGNPDIITFYSGEFGNDYGYMDKDSIVALKQLNLSFQNQVRSQGGTEPLCQADQFHVLITNNLNLVGASKEDSVQRIKDAVWKDLTAKFTWSPLTCSSTNPYISSGTANIADSVEKNKQTYIAFRYTNRPNNNTVGKSSIWRFQALTLTAVTELGSSLLMNQGNAGWQPVYEGGIELWNPTPFSIASTTSYAVTMRGPRTTTETYQMWCISKPFIITDTNLGKNPGIGIKSYTDVPLKSYSYIFTTAGTYNVVFLAINANKDSKQESVHQLRIVVKP
ncbi:DUF5017 domain-containing protein [Pedobacter sp. BS3]|uniref:DUF5017 domain-containing protein n=1 Tax=Pedobacter sp. BS3 TaxID=2567937 RepID=UPI0011EE50B1|nr:DUF5017 domain-containing protein [Pedobacter sp. BS3]TZF81102.1 DUF5017 domain-containing protein [Pedobacter sp. BS3]